MAEIEKGEFKCEMVGDLSVRFTKKVKAPRALVWRAHTEQSLLQQWWGPEGFTHVDEIFDVKVGGVRKFMFTGPDGTRYPNLIKFTEIKEPELIAVEHGDYEHVIFTVRTTFSEADGWTTIVSEMTFPKKETRDATVKFAEPGHQSTMRRLEALLTVMEGGTAPFVISRVFKAPRALVYDLYSKPEHQLPLLGDPGSKNLYSKLDFRVGGSHHYAMDSGNGQMWGLQRYLEIVPGEKIVFIQSFSDKDGGLGVHPMAPTWPKEMLTTITLADEPGKQCRVMVSWTPHNSDAAGNATFDAARGGMQGGFGHQFAKMDEYLAKIQG